MASQQSQQPWVKKLLFLLQDSTGKSNKLKQLSTFENSPVQPEHIQLTLMRYLISTGPRLQKNLLNHLV
jgi:hypothetical protein